MIRLLILYNITNILSSVREHMTIVIHLIDIVSSLGLKSPSSPLSLSPLMGTVNRYLISGICAPAIRLSKRMILDLVHLCSCCSSREE